MTLDQYIEMLMDYRSRHPEDRGRTIVVNQFCSAELIEGFPRVEQILKFDNHEAWEKERPQDFLVLCLNSN